MQFINLEIN